MHIYTYTCTIHIDAVIKTSEDIFKKIYPSLYWKGSKGLLKVLLWEGVGDRTELQHIDPHSYGHQRCVFLVLQGCSIRGPGAQLSAECWLSLTHLVSNSSDLQLLVSKLTDFLSSLSYVIVQRPLLLVGVIIARNQPIHGQGYNSDIPRTDAPVIYIGAFPILTTQPGRKSIYNNLNWVQTND